MQVELSIGDFSRMTHLGAQALRHYRDVGLLEPAQIDPVSGWYYLPNQVVPAQMIRRLRDMGMPLDAMRTIVLASDPQGRDAALVAHLRRMERQPTEIQQTIASMRTLLEAPQPQVEQRHLPATPALAVTERVSRKEAAAWWLDAFRLLHQTLRVQGPDRTGPDGALLPTEFFEAEEGELTVFVPVLRPPETVLPTRVSTLTVPAIDVAVVVHEGPHSSLDRAYGALGRWVLEYAAGAAGAIREYYHPTGESEDQLPHNTDVCWPVLPVRRVPS